jgi:hypothetical protein
MDMVWMMQARGVCRGRIAHRDGIATGADTTVFTAPNFLDARVLEVWREEPGLALRRAANAGRREV